MRFSSRHKWYILSVAAVISLLMAAAVTTLRFDYSVESFFPSQDPDLIFWETVQDKFSGSGSFVTIGIQEEESFFQGDRLLRLDSLTKSIGNLEGVIQVNSVTNLKNQVYSWLGNAQRSFFQPQNRHRYAADSAYFYAYQDVWVKFFSPEAKATVLYVEVDPELRWSKRSHLVSDLRMLLAEQEFAEPYLYGDIVAKDSNIRTLQREMTILSSLAFLLILIVLYLTFRSFWGIVLPILIVGLTVLWTLGTMAIFGATINMMTVLIPTIVSIVALSDVIHLMSRYKDYREEFSSIQALRKSIRKIRLVILLTSVTTGIGFLTLSYSNIQPFVEFGVFTAVGVLFAYLLAIGLLPVLLLLVPFEPKGRTDYLSLSQVMSDKVSPWIYRFSIPIVWASVIVVGLSLLGMTKVKVNSKLYDDISSGDEFSKTLSFMENNFGGIRSVEVYLELGDTSRTFLDREVIAQVKRLHDFLNETYQLADLSDITTVLKRAHRGINGGKPAFYTLPYDRDQAAFIDLMIYNDYEKLGINSVVTPDLKESRITGKTTDLGSYEIAQRNTTFFQYVQDSVDQSILIPKMTGVTHLLDKSNEIISRKLLYGLMIAIAIVSIMMGFLYRNWRMMVIAIIPNLLPLLMMIGIIGWMDIGMKMSTAIIFTIAFGIAVDDTIHMMSTLTRELKKGYTVKKAIRMTFATTGKAIVVTSVILICGFGILLFSSFQSSFLTGMLISITLMLALFADLLVLPALLVGFRRRVVISPDS